MKSFIPLESNPEVFTQLIHELGVSSALAFSDVLSLDEPDLLAFIPRPVLALILVFPAGSRVSPAYEAYKAEQATRLEAYAGFGEKEVVMWYKQTIGNACGLYGILHAVSNGPAREYIKPESTLSNLISECTPLPPTERAQALESSPGLEKSHKAAGVQGDTAPLSPDAHVDYHYICFVRSHQNGHLYEMDGARKGPVDLGDLLSKDEDLLSEKALDVIRAYINREEGGNLNFSLMALGPSQDD